MLSTVRAAAEGAVIRLVTAMMLLFLTLLVALIAAGFFVSAFYLWLTTMLPAHLAALATGGLMLLVGLIALLVWRFRRRGTPPVATQPVPPVQGLDSESVALMQRCLQGAGRRPDGLLAALALGVVAGLFSARPPGSGSQR